MPFVQMVGGHKYIVVPVVQLSLENLWTLTGIDLYLYDGTYKGHVPVHNIDPDFAHRLLKWAKVQETYNKVVVKVGGKKQK